MIPRYPNFKPLEASDVIEVTNFSRRHPPYSDFTFANLWAWDIFGESRLSWLDGNLVVRLNDYVTKVPHYTFLGSTDVSGTARELIRRSESEGLGARLKLIPEFMAHAVDRTFVQYDMCLDSSDYVFSVPRLARFDGGDHQSNRWLANRFARHNPTHRIERLDLTDGLARVLMLGLFETWADQKRLTDPHEEGEYRALDRLLHQAEIMPDLEGVGVFIGDQFVAFALFEVLNADYALGHFAKADTRAFKGVFPFMMRTLAEMLDARGIKRLNWQQDLGIPGLRQHKSSYAPTDYLRKYNLMPTSMARPSVLSIPAPGLDDRFLVTGMSDTLSLRAPAMSPGLAALVNDADDASPRSSQVRLRSGVVNDEELDSAVGDRED
jgi:hypothetical protein